MFVFETKIRVRYAETDQMGFVYYGNYSAYYEVARVEALRSMGLTYKDMEKSGVMMPVVENKSYYFLPARYDDLLTIQLRVKKVPEKAMHFEYDFFNEQNQLIHKGETVLVFYDMVAKKTCLAPDYFLSLFKPFFKEIEEENQ